VQFAETHPKPVKILREHISNIAAHLCVKPQDIIQILQKFKQSMHLRITVRSFLCDRIEDNQQWLFEVWFKHGMKQEEIAEQQNNVSTLQNYLPQGKKRKSIREKYRHFVFSMAACDKLFKTVSQIHSGPNATPQDLQIERQNSSTRVQAFLDESLRADVVTKYQRIQDLRKAQFDFIKSEEATDEDIKTFIDKVLDIPNIDLDDELRVAMDKLSILRISK